MSHCVVATRAMLESVCNCTKVFFVWLELYALF